MVYNIDHDVMQWCDGTDWIGLPGGGGGGSGCTGPDGPGGAILYNEDYAVLQWCDGTDWIGLSKMGASAWTQISAGKLHTCGLTRDGSVWCWGRGASGQLGNGGTADSSTPVLVSGGHTWQSIAAGGAHTCGVRSDGAAMCWGEGWYGRLGNGGTADQTTPVLVSGGYVWEVISAGNHHTCGIRTDGAAMCWGRGNNGELGDGNATDSPTPVLVSGGYTWQAIDTSYNYSCGIRNDAGNEGTAMCWGFDAYGKVGNGGGTANNYNTPSAVSGGYTWQSIATGSQHACGVRTDGAAMCWGGGRYGKIGDGTFSGDFVENPSPVLVVGGHSWQSVSSSYSNDGENSVHHTCGLRDDGATLCWGRGDYGQLGDGTTSGSISGTGTPVLVTGGYTWQDVSGGGYHTCGLLTDGRAMCWGWSLYGQLGNGETSPDWLEPTGAVLGVELLTQTGSGPGCTSPNAPPGTIIYNSDHAVMQWCDGNDWYGFKKPSYEPWPFSFPPLIDQAASTLVTSDIVKVTGMASGVGISISGDGAPEFRICDDSSCTNVIRDWSASASTMNADDYVQLRLTTSATPGATYSATVTVGTGSEQWDVTTLPNEKIVFVTSTTSDGSLGGITGADDICSTRADAASLSGTYKAWIANNSSDPASVFNQSTVPYKLTNGTTIANDWTDLVDGALAASIDRDEFGNAQTGDVWSNVETDGTCCADINVHCSNWTSNSGGSSRGYAGDSTSTTSTWTNTGNPQCNSSLRLYCFQQ